ncbi:hypothetical protein H4R21_004639, partial [Coemansia helicoidea]
RCAVEAPEYGGAGVAPGCGRGIRHRRRAGPGRGHSGRRTARAADARRRQPARPAHPVRAADQRRRGVGGCQGGRSLGAAGRAHQRAAGGSSALADAGAGGAVRPQARPGGRRHRAPVRRHCALLRLWQRQHARRRRGGASDGVAVHGPARAPCPQPRLCPRSVPRSHGVPRLVRLWARPADRHRRAPLARRHCGRRAVQPPERAAVPVQRGPRLQQRVPAPALWPGRVPRVSARHVGRADWRRAARPHALREAVPRPVRLRRAPARPACPGCCADHRRLAAACPAADLRCGRQPCCRHCRRQRRGLDLGAGAHWRVCRRARRQRPRTPGRDGRRPCRRCGPVDHRVGAGQDESV